MKKILVVGALQNEGEEIADCMLKKNQKVVIGTSQIHLMRKKYSPEVELVHFDFTDIESYNLALEDVNKILIISSYNVRPIEGMESFIDQLQGKEGIELICLLTINGMEQNPLFSENNIEKYLQDKELPFCIIKSNFYMQKIKGIYSREIMKKDKIVVPDKKAKISFISEQDTYEFVATIMGQAEEHRKKNYILTGQEALDYFEIETLLSNTLGRPVEYMGLKPEMVKEYWRGLREEDCEYADSLGIQHMISRMGIAENITHTFSDIMGREPITLKEYICKVTGTVL